VPRKKGASSHRLGSQSVMPTCVSRVMRNSMREMLGIGSGTFELPGALIDASRACASHRLEGAFALQLESSDLAFAMEDMTWNTPA
jgi:hypothetical protein